MMKALKSIPRITILGLLIALFGPPLVIYIAGELAPEMYTDKFIVVKELLVFAITTVLILLIYKGEKQTLASIGLHGKHWGKSILLALALTLISCAVLIFLAWVLSLAGIPVGGDEGGKYKSVSLWAWTLVVLRAGVVEEICYRGYVMERIEKWTGSWYAYFLIPLVIFALLHYSQGAAGIIISFIIGGILAFSYWKKRDLKANIIAHFLVDLVPNVILPLFISEL
ncbi:hypothetical protein DKG77_05790 [Flagellimonas aquimarina]|uniref:CAAX prenyl protease 2/Lysostaphin resistance protein A-like domain-containing protein n=1 Tax=Flagellimonas aquimarina TaxID=2201895 RepID=A0A316L391_9FLAO|nr:type II CAAX endopeptidase family protein [Allomuricauda koreensis]PWL40331.1 hypothetical protein DKG77_05790 [Allomuricauda koreensis]